MLISGRRLLILFVLVAAGCGAPRTPEHRLQPAPLDNNPVVVEKPALTTEAAPPEAGYEARPDVLINTQGGKKTEVLLGRASLTNTKLSYSQPDGFMRLKGKVTLLNDHHEKMAEKNFSLTGFQSPGESNVTLKQDEISGDGNVVVKAVATCTPDCSHIIQDVYIQFENKIYTVQLESSFDLAPKTEELPPEPEVAPEAAPEVKPAPAPAPQPQVTPAPTPAPVAPVAPITPSAPSEPSDLQSEEEDDSLDGRFEGTAQNENLQELFAPEAESARRAKPKVNPAPAPLPEMIQTPTGDVRPVNQAFGFPNSGTLRNATSLLQTQLFLKGNAPFEVAAPSRNRHFGTYELSQMIIRAGQEMEKIANRKLYVSAASAKNGGKIAPHKSHQMGVDADIGYPPTANTMFPVVVQMQPREFHSESYSTETTFKLFRFLFSQSDIRVDRIFVDQDIIDELCTFAKKRNYFDGEEKTEVRQIFQNLQHVDGHGDHFHLRIKCSPKDPGCRSRIYRKMNACG